MSKIAIITARGGSKRIPRKNIKSFLGKPIIAYSIKAALESNFFDQVMVSTDDEEIAEISLNYGASVPFLRSKENSDDYSGTTEVLLEVLQEYRLKGENFDAACCLYPTAPFVTGKKIKDSYEFFWQNNYETVFPVVRFSSPIQRALRVGVENKISMFYPENRTKRSQDLEEAFYDAGQFYWIRPELLKQNKKLWTENSGVVVYDETEVQDIDNEIDWKLAEVKFRFNNS